MQRAGLSIMPVPSPGKRDNTRCASFISLSRRSRKLRTAHEVIMRRLFIAASGKKLLCESLRLSQLLFSGLAAEIKCPILYENSLCLQFLPNEFDCML